MTANPPFPVFRLLLVCTANQCRSPMAEVMARSQLALAGVDAEVASCGIMEGGAPASPGAIRAMERRNLDLSAHQSHQMDSHTVEAANLIITMERRHITSVAELSLDAVRRSFTLGELAELAQVVGHRRPDTTFDRWIVEADSMRLPATVIAGGTATDIDDPMGGPRRAYRRTADQIDELLRTVFGSLFPTS